MSTATQLLPHPPHHRRPVDPLVLEVARVSDHLLGAERFCRSHPSPDAPEATRLLRALLLDELAAYRADGRFPRHHVPDAVTPVFVDANGTHCAVGHLLAVTGFSQLVARIASERNFARVHELTDEPGLVDWLAATGLSLDEAARIQPSYCSTPASMLCGDCSWGTNPPAAAGVIDGHVIAVAGSNSVTIAVDAIYGASGGLLVGFQIDGYVRSDASGPPSVGMRVVAPLPQNAIQDGGMLLPTFSVDAIAVGSDALVRCDPSAPGANVDAYATAKMSSDCQGALATLGSAWSRNSCDGGGCSTAASSGTSVELLLSAVPILVAFAVMRRRRR